MSTQLKAGLLILHVAVFVYGFQLQRLDRELSNLNRIGWSIYCSRGAALCLAMDMVLIMLPACRKLLAMLARLVHTLFGWGQGSAPEGSYSTPVLFHKYLAMYIVIFTAIHLGGHCINFYRLQILGLGSQWSYHFNTWAGLTGYAMLVVLGAMMATAHRRIRHVKFELFWYTHHLALVALLLLSLHGHGCFVKTNDGRCWGYNSWRYVVLAMALYALDRLLRFLDSRRSLPLLSATAHPGGALELCFRPPPNLQRYQPGQHLYLNIPTLSRFQWHPFTITSSPIETTLTLDIRQDGDWTCALGKSLGYGPPSSSLPTHVSLPSSSFPPSPPPLRLSRAIVVDDPAWLPKIRVDGPYGGPRRDVLDFDHAILIGTGTGITTFSGILRHIWFRHQITQSSRLKSLDLYWVTRDTKRLDWFKSLFSMDKTLELFRMGLIRIHIYFTRTTSSTTATTTSLLQDTRHTRRQHKETTRPANKRARAAQLERLVQSTRTFSTRHVQDQDPDQETTALTIQMDLSSDESSLPAVGSGRRDCYSDDDDDHEEHEELLSPQKTVFPRNQLPLSPTRSSPTATIPLATLGSPPPPQTPTSSRASPSSLGKNPPAAAAAAARTRQSLDEHDLLDEHAILGQQQIHYGRPDFTRILQSLKSTLEQQRTQQQEQQRGLRHRRPSVGSANLDNEDMDGLYHHHPSHAYRSSWSLWPPFRTGSDRQQQQHHSQPVSVGVFYCGSPPLAKLLERECKRISDRQIHFAFVTE